MTLVTKDDVLKAYESIKEEVTHTQLQYDRNLSEKFNCNVYFKREDQQKVRSFKLRGAYYAIKSRAFSEIEKGVVCASAGNHAQGVAYTCCELNIPAIIFMPTTTPNQKISQVEFFGGKYADVQLVGDTFDASAEAAKQYALDNHLPFIDPFDDSAIIAGQGTLVVEVFNDAKQQGLEIDYIFSAIGGGGLISGVSSYTKGVSPQTKVVGVEPLGAPSMAEAFKAGHPVKLAEIDKFVDGAAVREVGKLTYENAVANVDELLVVDEGEVCTTIIDLYMKQAIVAEPAGALSIAALNQMRGKIQGKNVVCIVSGGNNDINRMAEIDERSNIFEGYQHYFIVNFPQRPGALKEFVTDILGPNDDITRFEYTKRINRGSGPVVLGVLLKHREDITMLLENMARFDPNFIVLKDNQMLYSLLV